MDNRKELNVFMCSGQGSQFYGMGRELYTAEPVFRDCLNMLDEIASDYLGFSVVSNIYAANKSPTDPLDNLLISHPAIVMIEYALGKCLDGYGIRPDILLGTSLGEFTCFAMAEIYPIEDVLALVIKQAEAIMSSCEDGAMLAVLANPQLYLSEPAINQYSDLAAINFDAHFVISGEADELNRISDHLKHQGVSTHVISVQQAFHSRNIDCASAAFEKHLSRVTFSETQCSVFSCATNNYIENAAPIHLWNCVRRPILFQSAIQRMESENTLLRYIDIGPSGTLATFVKYNLTSNSTSELFPIMTMQGRCKDNLDKLRSVSEPLLVANRSFR